MVDEKLIEKINMYKELSGDIIDEELSRINNVTLRNRIRIRLRKYDYRNIMMRDTISDVNYITIDGNLVMNVTHGSSYKKLIKPTSLYIPNWVTNDIDEVDKELVILRIRMFINDLITLSILNITREDRWNR